MSLSLHEAFAPRYPTDSLAPHFEIWFAVVFDKASRRALWIRSTTLQPMARSGLTPRRVLWASLFDAEDPTRHRSAAEAQPLSASPPEAFGPARLAGRIETPQGPLGWDLMARSRHAPEDYAPRALQGRLAQALAGTHSVCCLPFAAFDGSLEADGETRTVRDATGLLTHIWGTRRVERLVWTFVPAFDGDGADVSLEAASVRIHPFLPPLTFVQLVDRGQLVRDASLRSALQGTLRLSYPGFELSARAGPYRISIRSRLDERQVTPYLYRDPDGRPHHVEQSDTGTVECRLQLPGRERELRCTAFAAVEFHGPSPWSARSYLDPYAALSSPI
jgi:hypothetical protein